MKKKGDSYKTNKNIQPEYWIRIRHWEGNHADKKSCKRETTKSEHYQTNKKKKIRKGTSKQENVWKSNLAAEISSKE